MVKQKLELNFTQGFIIGAIFSLMLMSVIIDKLFISKELFSKTKRIYVDGRIYKLCRDK